MLRSLSIPLLVGLLTVVVPSVRGQDEPSPPRTPDCVYVGTPNDVVAKMIEMAQIHADDFVCDPGCGDGRMVIAAARSHGCRGIGYEIDPRLAAEARQLAKKRKVEHLVQIEEKDIFTVDYRQNTVVVMYLLPEMIMKLLPKFRQLENGAPHRRPRLSDRRREARSGGGIYLQRGQRRAHALPIHPAAEVSRPPQACLVGESD